MLAGKNEISLKNKPIEIMFLNVYASLILSSLLNAIYIKLVSSEWDWKLLVLSLAKGAKGPSSNGKH